MPCYTVQTSSVDLGKLPADLLAAAEDWLRTQGVGVHREGARVQYRVDGVIAWRTGGTLESRQMSDETLAVFAGRLKGAVSRAAILRAAAANKWTVRQTGASTWEVQK